MLKYQNITIVPKGLNLKVDPKTATPGELIELENGIHSQPGTIQKRKGNAVLNRSVAPSGSFTDGRAIGVRNGEELVVSGTAFGTQGLTTPTTSVRSPRMWSRLPGSGSWAEIGTHTPIELSVESISRAEEYLSMPNGCIVDDRFLIYAAETRASASAAAATAARVYIKDLSTGGLVHDMVSLGVENAPKPIAIGTAALIFTADDAGTNISQFTWSSDAPGTIPAATANVISNLQTSELWDACEISASSCAVVWETTGNEVGIRLFSADGASATTATIAENPVGALACFRVSDGTTDYLAVVYQLNGSTTVRLALRNASTLAEVLAPTTILNPGATALNITGAAETNSSGVQQIRVYCEIATSIGSGALTFAGADGDSNVSNYVAGASLASKAFHAAGRAHVLLLHGSATTDKYQPTYFLHAADGGRFHEDQRTAHAKLFFGRAPYKTVYSRTTAAANAAGSLPQAISLGDDRWLIPGMKLERVLRAEAGSFNAPSVTVGLVGLTFDMSPAAGPATVAVGRNLYFGGGFLGLCDGRLQEHGFHLFAEYFTGASSATAGGLVASTAYSFRLVAEWTDRAGELHRSCPSRAVAVSTAVGQTSVDLTINALPNVDEFGFSTATMKGYNTRLYVYRTVAGSTGLYYKTGTYVANNPDGTTVPVNSGTVVDADLTSNEILYTEGDVLESIGPPAMHSIAAGRGRMAGIPSDDATAWWYTKAKTAGVAYEWSDLLTGRIEADGPNTAIAFQDDKWIIFKERAIYVVSGDGANNLGQGGYNEPYRLPGDIGCVDRASVLNTPVGLVFKSHKGIYMLAAGPQYIGAPVESYNQYSIVAAALEESAHRAIFFLSGGQPALVWDYETGQWGTYTNHENVVGAAVWQGKLAFLKDDGRVFHQTDEYLDDGEPYNLTVGFGWIAMAGALGWQRFRRIGLLCDWKSPHRLVGRVYYDYDDSVSYPLEFDATGSPGAYMLRARLPIQQCTAIRFVIEDEDAEGTGEGYSISGVTLEVGIRPGIYRLPASKTL